jgi:hypothetical protein
MVIRLILLLVLGCSIRASEQSLVPPIVYSLGQDAQVSLLLTRPDGSVARELLHAESRTKGMHSEAWDGLDEKGQPVAPGKYTWKMLMTHGLRAEYITTVGLSPTPRWQSWPGNHGAVASVAVDDGGVYLATGCGEATILALKQSLDGSKRLWTIPHWLEDWCGPTSMASDGGMLYMLNLSGKLFRTPSDKALPTGSWDLAMPGDRDASVFHDASSIMDLDAGGGSLVISYARGNLLRWIDPKQGSVIDSAMLTRPYGVAIDVKDGSVLAISEGQVVRLSRTNKMAKLVIAKDQLTGAWRLSVDTRTGDILVAENRLLQHWTEWQYFAPDHIDPNSLRAKYIYYARGEEFIQDLAPPGGNQIKRFSRSGVLLATYGALEGHQQGPHVATDFSGLVDIAATGDGGFIAVEQGLVKRTVRCDAHGKVLNEWFGGWGYGQHSIVDPGDPTVIWITDRSHFNKTRINLATKTWEYLASYECKDIGRWFDQDGPVWRIVRHQGAMFFALVGWQGVRGPCLIRLDEARRRMVMCDAGGGDLTQDVALHTAACAHPLFPDYLKKEEKSKVNHSWTWSDLNGDGVPQEIEMVATPWGGHVGGWHMTDDFTWYFHSQNDALTEVNICRLPVNRWTDSGAPVYTFADVKVFAQDPGWSESVLCDGASNVFAAFNHAGVHDRNFGLGGWSGRAAMNRVAKFNAEGALQWIVGRHAAGSGAAPGEGHYLIRIVGTVKGCVVVNDMEYGYAHVWDQDGLWVGRLLENPIITDDSPLSAYEQCGENFGGSIYVNPSTGEVLYVGGGINGSPVYRITGWDAFQRQTGTIEISPACAATLLARTQIEAKRTDIAHFAFVEAGAFKIDGDLGKWKAAKPILIRDGNKEVAKLYLGWSSEYLYAAFDVTTSTPWKNASNPALAFQGGAAVDFSLGPLAPHTAAGNGDARYLAALIEGKNQVMEYYPLLPKDMSPPHHNTHTAFKTQVGEVVFDRAGVMQISQTNAVEVTKPDGSGYIVEMRALRHPPYEFAPGFRFRFDASVILSDPSGTKSTIRIPWHSTASEDSMTTDTYTEALLRPANWGEGLLD